MVNGASLLVQRELILLGVPPRFAVIFAILLKNKVFACLLAASTGAIIYMTLAAAHRSFTREQRLVRPHETLARAVGDVHPYHGPTISGTTVLHAVIMVNAEATPRERLSFETGEYWPYKKGQDLLTPAGVRAAYELGKKFRRDLVERTHTPLFSHLSTEEAAKLCRAFPSRGSDAARETAAAFFMGFLPADGPKGKPAVREVGEPDTKSPECACRKPKPAIGASAFARAACLASCAGLELVTSATKPPDTQPRFSWLPLPFRRRRGDRKFNASVLDYNEREDYRRFTPVEIATSPRGLLDQSSTCPQHGHKARKHAMYPHNYLIGLPAHERHARSAIRQNLTRAFVRARDVLDRIAHVMPGGELDPRDAGARGSRIGDIGGEADDEGDDAAAEERRGIAKASESPFCFFPPKAAKAQCDPAGVSVVALRALARHASLAAKYGLEWPDASLPASEMSKADAAVAEATERAMQRVESDEATSLESESEQSDKEGAENEDEKQNEVEEKIEDEKHDEKEKHDEEETNEQQAADKSDEEASEEEGAMGDEDGASTDHNDRRRRRRRHLHSDDGDSSAMTSSSTAAAADASLFDFSEEFFSRHFFPESESRFTAGILLSSLVNAVEYVTGMADALYAKQFTGAPDPDEGRALALKLERFASYASNAALGAPSPPPPPPSPPPPAKLTGWDYPVVKHWRNASDGSSIWRDSKDELARWTPPPPTPPIPPPWHFNMRPPPSPPLLEQMGGAQRDRDFSKKIRAMRIKGKLGRRRLRQVLLAEDDDADTAEKAPNTGSGGASFYDPFAVRGEDAAAHREEAASMASLPWEEAGVRSEAERFAANEAVGERLESYNARDNVMVDFSTAEGKPTVHASQSAALAEGVAKPLPWYRRFFGKSVFGMTSNRRADQNMLPYLPKPPRLLVYVGSTDTVDGLLASLGVPAANRRLPIRPLDTVTLRVTKKFQGAGAGKGWFVHVEHNGAPVVLSTLCPDGVCKANDFVSNARESQHMFPGGWKKCFSKKARFKKQKEDAAVKRERETLASLHLS